MKRQIKLKEKDQRYYSNSIENINAVKRCYKANKKFYTEKRPVAPKPLGKYDLCFSNACRACSRSIKYCFLAFQRSYTQTCPSDAEQMSTDVMTYYCNNVATIAINSVL